MHRAAGLDDLLLEPLEIEIEMRQRPVLDVARLVAQGFELGQAFGSSGAALDEAVLDMGERLLQRRVRQGVVSVLFEVSRGRLQHS